MDQDLKQQLDRMEKFLMQHMVTKEEFNELSVRVDRLEQTIGRLTDAIEKLTLAVHGIAQEHTVMKHQMMVMQDWIRRAADKVGVEFKL